MRYAAGALVLLPAAVLQVTLAPRLEVAGAFPNLVLVAVVGWTLARGAAAGIRWALAAGLLLDLVSPGPLGVHALGLVVAAYLAGFAQRYFEPDPIFLPTLSGAAATVVYNLVLIAIAMLTRHPIAFLPVLQLWVAPSSLYDALLMPVALFLLRRVDRALPQPIGIDW